MESHHSRKTNYNNKHNHASSKCNNNIPNDDKWGNMCIFFIKCDTRSEWRLKQKSTKHPSIGKHKIMQSKVCILIENHENMSNNNKNILIS